MSHRLVRLRQSFSHLRCLRAQYQRRYSSDLPRRLRSPEEITAFLENSTVSIRDFLPSKASASFSAAEEIELTSATLHHLLRLSALPPPVDERSEEALLKTLHEHLHFVRSIQSVDTTGVSPLVRIEGPEGSLREEVIGFTDVVGAEERLNAQEVGAMGWGKDGWKVKELVEGDRPEGQVERRPKGKGMVGGYYVVQETEEGGAH